MLFYNHHHHITKAESARACVYVTFERSDWPVARVYKVQRRAGLIMVGGGRRRGWGTLAGGSEQELMSSGKTRWESLPWRGQRPTRKPLTLENSQPPSPSATECKQKPMESGGVARIYGTMVGGPNNGLRATASRVGHLGWRGPNRK